MDRLSEIADGVHKSQNEIIRISNFEKKNPKKTTSRSNARGWVDPKVKNNAKTKEKVQSTVYKKGRPRTQMKRIRRAKLKTWSELIQEHSNSEFSSSEIITTNVDVIKAKAERIK